jgi:16S rRNA (uracil1498-N3)-methyltransferase
MARRLFFVPEVRRGTAELNGPQAEHLVRVLRVEVGDIYEISDNERRYLAKIGTARKSTVTFEVLEPLEPGPDVASVHLYPAIFKFDRLEWMIEKATELGVTSIHPFESTRTERGLMQAAAKRLSRWQRVVLEASQQSRRLKRPEINPAVKFQAAIEGEATLKLMLDEADAAPGLLSVVTDSYPTKTPSDHIAVIVGPEGGWTDEERERIIAAGWKQCSLGSTILRAETAAIAGLSAINVLWSR